MRRKVLVISIFFRILGDCQFVIISKETQVTQKQSELYNNEEQQEHAPEYGRGKK